MTYHLSVKTGGKGAAARHAKYIGRRGAFESKSEDLVDTFSGNLPGWTSGDTTKFWQTADKFERSNAAVYREYEGALPAELTHAQMRSALEDWMQFIAPNKPYEVAIHEPVAALGGVPQPHFHAMVSDRVLDGIDRPAELHFRRYNPKNPEAGGSKKDSGGRTPLALRNELKETRKAFADLLNRHLEANGHLPRLDHRSHEERGLSAEPGRHLGPARVQRLRTVQSQNLAPQ